MDQTETFMKSLEAIMSRSKELNSAHASTTSGERGQKLKSCNFGDFYVDGKITCPRCSAPADKIEQERLVKGCRMNGDSYGAFTRLCSNCGMFARHDFDDHD